MDYRTLIRDAWAITWRYRFLWLLGLLAGGSAGLPGLNGGSGAGGRGQGALAGPDDLQQINPALAVAARDVSGWAAANVGLLVTIAAIVTLLLIALLIISFIAQGGIAEATADLALGRTSSLARAWSSGVHLFWRYVGLWLMLAVGALLIAAAIALVAAIAIVVATLGQSPAFGIGVAAGAVIAVIVGFDYLILHLIPENAAPAWLIAAVATLFALPLFTVVIASALVLSIVVAFAQRAIAVENIGPVASLRSGWNLMRAHLSESLVTWLINVALTLACGVVCLAGVVGILVLLGGIGVVVFAFAGFTAPTIAYMGLGSIVFVAIALTIIGIANTFFWTYWTLAYLRLSGRAVRAAGAAGQCGRRGGTQRNCSAHPVAEQQRSSTGSAMPGSQTDPVKRVTMTSTSEGANTDGQGHPGLHRSGLLLASNSGLASWRSHRNAGND